MILAIIQARYSSSRLPGKVLKNIINKPMIIHEIERIKRSKYIDQLLLATSLNESDDALVEKCKQNEIVVFRGDLENVLDRFYQACAKYNPDHIVRLTGDCPLIDWNIIDSVIQLHLKENNDYTSNTLQETYPDGLDVEIMKFNVLEYAWENAKLPSEKEHVTPYIYRNPKLFKLGCLRNNTDLSNMRWTVDELEDFIFVRKVYELLYPGKPDFTMDDVLNFLKENSEIQEFNQKFIRNEGFEKSLKEDVKKLLKEDK